MIVAGIDEAGYGPLLGPLVVSAVAFEIADHQADDCLWQRLRGSVTHRVRTGDPRVVIADSKKLHSRGDGLANLERSALTSWSAREATPTSLVELLNRLAPQALPDLQRSPWFADIDLALPVAASPGIVATGANAFSQDLRAAGIRFLGAWSEPLTAAAYNRMVASTRNKAVVLFSLTVRLMQRIADAFPGRPLRFVVDRQGGRHTYRAPLMRAFELPELVVLEESTARSAYAIRTRPIDWTVAFVRKGEDAHLPIALASIFAKYQRELFMQVFNRFFRRHRPDLVPTAGYYTDGQRFLKDIQAELPALGIDLNTLVRVS